MALNTPAASGSTPSRPKRNIWKRALSLCFLGATLPMALSLVARLLPGSAIDLFPGGLVTVMQIMAPLLVLVGIMGLRNYPGIDLTASLRIALGVFFCLVLSLPFIPRPAFPHSGNIDILAPLVLLAKLMIPFLLLRFCAHLLDAEGESRAAHLTRRATLALLLSLPLLGISAAAFDYTHSRLFLIPSWCLLPLVTALFVMVFLQTYRVLNARSGTQTSL